MEAFKISVLSALANTPFIEFKTSSPMQLLMKEGATEEYNTITTWKDRSRHDIINENPNTAFIGLALPKIQTVRYTCKVDLPNTAVPPAKRKKRNPPVTLDNYFKKKSN